MTTISQTAVNNHFRTVCEVGSMKYVVLGLSYRVTTKRASAVFTKVEQADINRMVAWIEYWS